MTDWPFRISSVANFAADLDAFCAAEGYPLLTQDDGNGGRTVGDGAEIEALIRFDFVIFDITTLGVDKGLHVNARASLMPNADQTAAAVALSTLAVQLAAFFASQPTVTNTIPAQYGGGTQTWHATANGTALISPAPKVPKMVWA